MTTKKSQPEKQQEEIESRTAPPGDVVYQAIHDEGEHELQRGNSALALSGLAAGLSMGFSLVSEALLRVYLPDAPWVNLIAKLGYSVGYLIVILGRQQLFTKNTLTVILPLLKHRNLPLLMNVARLWAAVLLGNLAGAALFAGLLAHTSLFDEPVRQMFSRISSHAMEPAAGTLFLRAILSGWLIALMVWLLPFAEAARVWVIIIIGYLVGLSNLPHVIAGGVESFYLVWAGTISLAQSIGGYLLPALLGNVVGGVLLVAVGAHAEFRTARGK
ncbi:MAG: formate/nitrite transporter family protein [Chthoniobacterales bacterium]